jgi:HPt (histidine-containing phosphotransfer) domain-containing protein
MNDTRANGDGPIMDLESLKGRCLGNLDLVERVIQKFASQLDHDLEELERALLAQDADTLASVAHRVKGMSANVEAWPLHTSAVKVERCALQRQFAELKDQLASLREERERLASGIPSLLPAE